MIRDYNKYYGSVFCQLIDRTEVAVGVQRLNELSQGFYLIENSLPLYIKYSKSRRGPWTFNFKRDHIDDYLKVLASYQRAIIAFVCGTDGIAALTHMQVPKVLDLSAIEQDAMTVRRRLNEMYSFRGSVGDLDGKVGRESLSEAVDALL